MDDQRLANWVGAGALGLVLAAVVWLLVSPGSGSGGSDELLQVNGTQPLLNPNYGKPTSYQQPLSMRVGLRLSF